jgi:hypothetical protein
MSGDGRSHGENSVKLSIVTTLYRSAASIEEFHRRIMKAAEPMVDDIEFVVRLLCSEPIRAWL